MRHSTSFLFRLLLVSALVVPVASAVTAQGADSAGPVFTPRQWLQEFMGRLELAPEQLQQIVAIFQAHAVELQLSATGEFVARRALQKALHRCEANEAAVRLASAAVAAVDLEFNQLRARIFREVYPVLTAQQWEELASLGAVARGFIADALERCGTAETPPAALAALAERAAVRLGLSAEQVAQLQAVALAHRPAMCELLRQEAAARNRLREAIHRIPADEAAVAEASQAVAWVDAEFNLERAAMFSAVCAVLTEEQKGRIQEMAERLQAAVERVLAILAGALPRTAL